MRVKLIRTLILFVFLMSVFSINKKTKANEDAIDKYAYYEEWTSNDSFTYGNTNYSIFDYSNSMINGKKNLYGLNTEYTFRPLQNDFYPDVNNPALTEDIMVIKGDDPIVAIIPKELFRIPNVETIHIGTEYGFFVKNEELIDRSGAKYIYSNVYVFDLNYDDITAANHIKFKIQPLFQREYVYLNVPKDYVYTRSIDYLNLNIFDSKIESDIQCNDVVAAIPYGNDFGRLTYANSDKYFLSNIENVVTLYNEQHLNLGDVGYIPEKDMGKFITQQDVEYNAKIYNVNDNAASDARNALLKTAFSMAAGALIDLVPGASTTIDILEGLINAYEASLDEILSIEKKFTYIANYVTSQDQIEHYGNLYKTAISRLEIDFQNGDYGKGSYLFYDLGDFVTYDYQIGYTPVQDGLSYKIPWEARIKRGLNLEFRSLKNNSSLFTGANVDEHKLQQTLNREFKDLKETNKVNLLANGENLYTYTPERSGNYILQTNGAENLINIEVTGNNYSDLIMNSININDKQLSINLLAGNVYQFRINFIDNKKYGLFDLALKFLPPKVLLGNNNVSMKYLETFVEFIPENNAYYKFIGNSLEINEVFDASFRLVAYESNYYFLLNKNQKYYINIRKNNYNSDNIILKIEDQMTITFYKHISEATNCGILNYSSLRPVELLTQAMHGYKFLGWKTTDGQYVNNQNIKNFMCPELILYGDWEIQEYNIYYHDQNGIQIAQDKYTIESGFNLNKAPQLSDYIILNWFDENGNQLTESFGIIGDKFCFPNYVKKTSIISFDCQSEVTDGITASMSNGGHGVNIDYNVKVILPIPSVVGFNFIGWYNGEIQVSNELGIMQNNINFTNDTTVSAKWIRTHYYFNVEAQKINDKPYFTISMRNEANKFDISITKEELENNVIAISHFINIMQDKLREAFLNNNLNLDSFKPGYYLKCFTTIENKINTEIKVINPDDLKGNLALYPYYIANEYRLFIQYSVNDIQFVFINYEKELLNYNHAQSSFTPEININQSGYKFLGYFLTDFIKMYDQNAILTQEGLQILQSSTNQDSFYVTPKKSGIMYNIRYNPNGGSMSMMDSQHIYGTPQELNSNAFIRDGYLFDGWSNYSTGRIIFTNSQSVLNLASNEGDTFDLYAIWKAITYEIQFDPNGGSGDMNSILVTYDASINLSYNDFSKIGSKFVGWSHSRDGDIAFVNGASVTNLSASNSAVVRLYAKWELEVYTISYRGLLPNMIEPYPRTYTYGTYITLPTIIEYYNGMEILEFNGLLGWYNDSSFRVQRTYISNSSTGNIIIYAKYNYKQYPYYNLNLIRVTDNARTKINVLYSYNSYYNEVKNVFNKVEIEIKLYMREIDDGYQEIYFYGGNTELWSINNYEYGGNKKDSNWRFVSFKFIVGMDYLSTFTQFRIEFGAHGTFSDDWEINQIAVYFNYYA